MRPRLMHRDRDFDPEQALAPQAPALTQDLELETLFRAMAGEDRVVYGVARSALLGGLRNDIDTIRYRLAIAQDGLRNPEVVRELYALANEALARKRRGFFLGILGRYPSSILYGAIELLELYVEMLKRLRSLAQAQAGRFESAGYTAFFAMLERELDDAYFAAIDDHLNELKFRDGVRMSAALGPGNEGRDYVLHRARPERRSWLKRLLGQASPAYTYRLHERDEAGARALSELRDRGIHLIANALAQSMDHIQAFFELLRTELAFYVGCLNLRDRLAAIGAPVALPQPAPTGTRRLRFRGLYDPCLALSLGRRPVGNDLDADGKSLMVITGANTGGKSTFLRGLGLAQLMMQCGMVVGAESCAAELCADLHTHYQREEDRALRHGKLDEELARMSAIADLLCPDTLLLFSESFASTNEREGSEIARQVVTALRERRVKVAFVTHLYDFAHGLYEQQREDAIFLRAERQPDGTRSFRLIEGEPLQTSYGRDLYREVFAPGPAEVRG